jgi:hypothetical protein
MADQRQISRALAMAMILSFGILMSAAGSAAQATRRPTPQPTVTPPRTEPVIISRADDFPEDPGLPERTIIQAGTQADDATVRRLEELLERIKTLESGRKNDLEEKRRRLLLNLEILTKAEQRSESLRKQLFEMIEKESTLQARLDVIEIELRPDAIDRSVAFAGSLRPEELRETRRRTLAAERTSIQSMMLQVQRNRSNLDLNIQRADDLVERLRTILEKDIDSALDQEKDDGTPVN